MRCTTSTPRTSPPRDAALNQPGQWKSFEITLVGTRIQVFLNGVKVNDFTSPRAVARGYIGVQNDGAGLDISYRNIRIRENNLARSRPVSVSSVETGNVLVGANAVDGDPATRWGSQYADPQWLSVDLGSVKTLSQVRLHWEVAYARTYRIETSTDGAAWNPVWSTTAGDGGVDDITLPAGTSGRHSGAVPGWRGDEAPSAPAKFLVRQIQPTLRARPCRSARNEPQ